MTCGRYREGFNDTIAFKLGQEELNGESVRENWRALFLNEVSSSVRCKLHVLILRLDSPLSSSCASLKVIMLKSYFSKSVQSFSCIYDCAASKSARLSFSKVCVRSILFVNGVQNGVLCFELCAFNSFD